MKIDLLKQQESELLKKLNEVRAEIESENLLIIEQTQGIRIGSRVFDRGGVECCITKIDMRWKRPWLSVVKKKKDGTFGKREYKLHDAWTT